MPAPTPDVVVNAKPVAIVSRPLGTGYWIVTADGGVFAFGSAEFFGSAAGLLPAGEEIIAASGARHGYVLLGSSGGVYAFDAEYKGRVVFRG